MDKNTTENKLARNVETKKTITAENCPAKGSIPPTSAVFTSRAASESRSARFTRPLNIPGSSRWVGRPMRRAEPAERSPTCGVSTPMRTRSARGSRARS